jgi:hypothetical protein
MSDAVFITPEKLIERWGNAVTVETLSNWRFRGRGPRYTKVGTKVMYALADIEEYERVNQTGGENVLSCS